MSGIPRKMGFLLNNLLLRNRKCDELEAKLEQLGVLAQQESSSDTDKTGLLVSLPESIPAVSSKSTTSANVTQHDVLSWAEEVG